MAILKRNTIDDYSHIATSLLQDIDVTGEKYEINTSIDCDGVELIVGAKWGVYIDITGDSDTFHLIEMVQVWEYGQYIFEQRVRENCGDFITALKRAIINAVRFEIDYLGL